MKAITTLFLLVCSYWGLAQNSGSPILFKLQGHNDDLECMAISGNGKLLASGSYDGLLNLFGTDSNYTPSGSFTNHLSAINTIMITNNGKFIATGGDDGKVYTYKADSFGYYLQDQSLFPHRLAVTSVYIDGAGKYVYTGSTDGTICFTDIFKKKEKRIQNNSPVHSIAITNDRRNIFCSDNTPVIKKYDLEGKLIDSYEGHTDQVNHILLTRDNKYLISASNDKTIRIWNVQNGKLERTLTGHDWKVWTLAISVNGMFIASGSNDGSTKIWDFETGKELKSFDNIGTKVRGLAFSNDCSRLYVAMEYPVDSFESKGILALKSGVEIPKKEPPKVPGKNGTPYNKTKPGSTGKSGTPVNGKATGTTTPETKRDIIKKTPEIEISEDQKKPSAPVKDGQRQD